MDRRFIGVAAAMCVLAFAAPSMHAQAPGEALPAERRARVKALAPELERAMAAKDEASVAQVVGQIRAALGPYAGVPESPEKHFTPIDVTRPPVEKLARRWEDSWQSRLATRGARSALAQNNQMELRESAYIALACLAMAELDSGGAPGYVARAREELDYLVSRQHRSGMFPYPAEPGGSAPPNVRAMVKKLREERPEAIENGFIVLALPDMQFDTGCCGFALCEGYRVTGEERYLAAAKKAGQWAASQRLCANWNYNAFSVWLLAKLHSITDDSGDLDSAIEKAALGVLPGLMENGRWVDPHNAKQSYHWIMVRALAELVRAMPGDHARYEEFRAKTLLAAEARAGEIVRDGVSNVESALWGLSAFLEALGPNRVCEQAADATVNAAVSAGKEDVLALPLYLRCRKNLSE
ncbi:MAG: hypothetical protein GWP08_02765, partial [Nitrospiraceae bacterium]|nr:hypothetical protein [Nitrospiraceae bacterium]